MKKKVIFFITKSIEKDQTVAFTDILGEISAIFILLLLFKKILYCDVVCRRVTHHLFYRFKETFASISDCDKYKVKENKVS